MKVKLTYILIAILTALGGLNLYQSLKKKLLPEKTAYAVEIESARPHKAEHRVHVYTLTDADGETVLDERFKVSGDGRLAVDIEHADLTLLNGNRDEVHVVVTVEGDDMDRARELFEEAEFQVEQDGNTVTVTAHRPDRNVWSWDHTGGADIDVTVTVPEHFDLDLKTTHGDVGLATHEGALSLRTSHGDVEARALSGPRIRLETSHGDIEAAHLIGDDITLKTSHGDIELGDVEATSFSARTSHADLEINRLAGRADVTNAHGDIEVALASTDAAYFRTTHGDIVIEAPARFGADLTLKAERVRLGDSFAFDGTLEEDRADGRLNGGGPRLEARTSHGSVVLRGLSGH